MRDDDEKTTGSESEKDQEDLTLFDDFLIRLAEVDVNSATGSADLEKCFNTISESTLSHDIKQKAHIEICKKALAADQQEYYKNFYLTAIKIIPKLAGMISLALYNDEAFFNSLLEQTGNLEITLDEISRRITDESSLSCRIVAKIISAKISFYQCEPNSPQRIFFASALIRYIEYRTCIEDMLLNRVCFNKLDPREKWLQLTDEQFNILLELARNNRTQLSLFTDKYRNTLGNDDYQSLFLKLIEKDYSNLKYIDESIINFDFLKRAILINPDVINSINNEAVTKEEHQLLLKFAQRQKVLSFCETFGIRALIIYFENKLTTEQLLTILMDIFNENKNSVLNLKAKTMYDCISANAHQLSYLLNLLRSIESLMNNNKLIETLNIAGSLRPETSISLFKFLFEKYNLNKLKDSIFILFNIEDKYKIQINDMISKFDFRIILILNMIKPFTQEFGNLRNEHALLTCAQVASRKNYIFDPVILDCSELKYYLSVLSKNKDHDLRTRFIISGGHWRTGDIVLKNGSLSVLLIDSIGLENCDYYGIKMLLKDIAVHFKKENIQFQLYFDPTKRQHSTYGCSVFCIDDVLHLFSLEKHLGCSVFDYFQAQKDKTIMAVDAGININIVKLPLSLMRTMQTKDLFHKIIPSRDTEETNKTVNKKGETTYQSASRFFLQNDMGEPTGINRRLVEKLISMGRNNLIYLLTHSPEDVERAMNQFTLAHFEKKHFSDQNAPPAPELL